MQKKNSLRATSVVKEKRDGTFKGCVCADGIKQRQCRGKQQTASLIVHADSFMLTTDAEPKEGRETATTGIKGACLYTEQDEFTVVEFVDE